jgi:2-oxoglutarate ferredoxin oxidoreductase subunit alpha
VRAFVVPEINMGQMVREVERCAQGQALVLGANRPGGDILEADLVLNVIRQAAGRQVRPEERRHEAASSLAGGEEE